MLFNLVINLVIGSYPQALNALCGVGSSGLMLFKGAIECR